MWTEIEVNQYYVLLMEANSRLYFRWKGKIVLFHSNLYVNRITFKNTLKKDQGKC